MVRGHKLPDREGGYVFTVQVPASRPREISPRASSPTFRAPLCLWKYT
jgi:hypothetical protein